jgi:lipoate-protein ligase A
MASSPGSWTVRVDALASFGSVLAVQEELLRQGEPAVHAAVLEWTVLSYGVGVSASASYLRRAQVEGVSTARRTSGGTGVLHLAGDLVWAVVLPRSDPRVGREFVRSFPRFGAGLVPSLASGGHHVAWVPAPGLSVDYCPLSDRGQVLEVGGKVVGAAAQHLTGRALLHHGSLSIRIDRELVGRLFSFPDPAIATRLSGLWEQGLRVDPGRLAGEIARGLVTALEPL